MAKLKTFVVDIQLNEQQQKFLCGDWQPPTPDTAKVQRTAQEAMSSLGDGGVVLDGKIVEQLSRLIGKAYCQQDIVKLVEAGLHRKNGSVEVSWTPDPQYIPVLEELARTRGASVQGMAQDIMDHATGAGWFYQFRPDTKILFLSREQGEMIAEWLGRKENFTGQDLFDALFNKSKAA